MCVYTALLLTKEYICGIDVGRMSSLTAVGNITEIHRKSCREALWYVINERKVSSNKEQQLMGLLRSAVETTLVYCLGRRHGHMVSDRNLSGAERGSGWSNEPRFFRPLFRVLLSMCIFAAFFRDGVRKVFAPWRFLGADCGTRSTSTSVTESFAFTEVGSIGILRFGDCNGRLLHGKCGT